MNAIKKFRIEFLLAALLAFASLASAQGYQYVGTATRPGTSYTGNVSVAVCAAGAATATQPCSPLATIYTDATLTTQATSMGSAFTGQCIAIGQ